MKLIKSKRPKTWGVLLGLTGATAFGVYTGVRLLRGPSAPGPGRAVAQQGPRPPAVAEDAAAAMGERELQPATLDVPEANEPRSGRPVAPEVEGSAGGLALPLAPGADLWASLSAHPAPEIWLDFPAATRGDGNQAEPLKVGLPEKAREMFSQHWGVACAYYYAELNGEKDQESRIERLTLLANASGRLISQLKDIKIDAPGGRRNVSEREAAGLAQLLNTFAKNLVQRAGGGDIGT